MARTAAITGGTGALGQAVVERLLADGVVCHVTWKFERELAGFRHADAVTLHEVDCGSEADVAGFYAGLGALDASVHIVGGFGMAAIEHTSRDDFVGMFELNAVTAFLCCRESVRKMRAAGGGRIVNVAARPAVQPVGGMIAYTTAKAAVASLTQCLAEEVRDAGICVNAILPSIMDTPANRSDMPGADFDRWPKVAEVADVIAFLAGPDSRLTSGALVPVFGRG
jgi:NAD(P)-dependent dehydrogenase (short-subunit alcohol dehydrogenase family)